jgi:exodeoxyribonuclease VII small subunit
MNKQGASHVRGVPLFCIFPTLASNGSLVLTPIYTFNWHLINYPEKYKTVKYEEASRELQTIIDQLQEESVPIDELGEKTKRAAELIRFCRQKLRTTQQDLDQLFAEDEEES